jgi:betaine-aldehyde dehydrogenase
MSDNTTSSQTGQPLSRAFAGVVAGAARLLIGGELTTGDGERLVVEDPFLAAPLGTLRAAGPAQVAAAVRAARAAAPGWARTSPAARAEALHAIAASLRARSAELAAVMAAEGGKPLAENRDEIAQAAGAFDFYAQLGRASAGRVVPAPEHGQLSLVLKQPVGVVGCITPWNFPLLLWAWKAAPALAAGNAIVCKPSELTPFATLLLAGSLEHLPAGVVNLLAGGPQVGEAIVADAGVDCVAFTGSVAAGRRIGSLAAGRIARVNLELGGKDPFIVCEDVADELALVARAAAWSAFFNAGQVCAGAERFYVVEPLYEPFVEALAAETGRLVVGDPFDPATDVGPLASAPQRARVQAQLDAALAAGAELRCGGQRPPAPATGHFMTPGVVTGAPESSALMREETFGPLAPVARVRDLDEAIARANASDLGLGATVCTRDLDAALTAAHGLECGMVWINDPLTENDASPFGGAKRSGLGRELGDEGLDAFRETKRVHVDGRVRAREWWFPYAPDAVRA